MIRNLTESSASRLNLCRKLSKTQFFRVKHSEKEDGSIVCDSNEKQKLHEEFEITYSYSVKFEVIYLHIDSFS
jgi:hypothetical protein